MQSDFSTECVGSNRDELKRIAVNFCQDQPQLKALKDLCVYSLHMQPLNLHVTGGNAIIHSSQSQEIEVQIKTIIFIIEFSLPFPSSI